MGPSNVVFLVTCAWCPRNVFCVGCVCPPVVVKVQLLLACEWVGLTSGWLPVRVTVTVAGMLLCLDWLIGARVALVGHWCPLSLAFRFVICGAAREMLWCVLILSLGMLGLEPPGKGSSAGQGQLPFVSCLGSPSRSFKVMYSWLPLAWDLEMLGRGYTVCWGWALLIPVMGPCDGHHSANWDQTPPCQVCGCLVKAVFQANTGYCLCQAWGLLMGVNSASWDPSPLLLGLRLLIKSYKVHQGQLLLWGVRRSFRHFGKVHSSSQGRVLFCRSCWKRLGLGKWVGWDRVLESSGWGAWC